MSDDDGESRKRTKHFTPDSVATCHVAIALCVEEFFRSPGTPARQKREEFAKLLDEKFHETLELVSSTCLRYSSRSPSPPLLR